MTAPEQADVPLDAALAGRHAIWNTDLSRVAAHPLGPWIIRFMHATQEHDAAVRKVGLHCQLEVDRLQDIYRAARDLAEAVAAQERTAPEAERGRLRDGIAALLAEVTASAEAGGPHAHREHDLAIALRRLLDPE